MKEVKMSVVKEATLMYCPSQFTSVPIRVQVGIWGSVDLETGVSVCVTDLCAFFAFLQEEVDKSEHEDSTFPSEQLTFDLICVWVANQLMGYMDTEKSFFPGFVRVYLDSDCFIELKLSTATS